MCAMPLEHEIEYPTSDGQPMAETTLHREVMSDMIGGLERHHAGVPDVWVGGNLFLYYRKGDPSACIAPDVLLVKGVKKGKRPSYLLWEEKEPPSLVFEITSQSTRKEDQDKKRKTYQRLGVEELILFDPYGEYLKPRLQGYRLDGQGGYQPIPPNMDGSLDSRTTGLKIRPEGERLRLVNPATGEPLLWSDELDAARQAEAAARRAAEKRAAEEAAARQAAEERIRALEEELARLRARDQS